MAWIRSSAGLIKIGITVTISGLTTNATYGLTAQYGSSLTAVVTGAPGGATITYGWLEGAVQRASGSSLSLTAGGSFGDLQTIYAFAVVDGVTYTSPGYTIRYAAPTGVSSLADVTQTVGDPTQTLSVAAAVSGSALSYSVATNSIGVTINPTTGLATIPFNFVVAASTVTYTVTNSGGSVSRAHSVTIADVVPVAPSVSFTQGATATYFASSTGLPYSLTYTPISGATGTVIAVLMPTSVGVPTVKMGGTGGTVATLVSQVATTGAAWTEYVFYSSGIASPVYIANPSFTSNDAFCVQVLSVNGGTIRGNSYQTYTPASLTAGATWTFPTINVKNGDLVVISIPNGRAQYDTTTISGFTKHAGVTASLLNSLFSKAITADGTLTVPTITTPNPIYQYGGQLSVISQYQSIVAIPDEPVVSNFVHALNQARTSATIPVSGVYIGTSADIQERVVNASGTEIVGWTTVQAGATGNTYSGTLTIPATNAALYRQSRKGTDLTTMRQQATNFQVGLHIIASGQSNLGVWLATQNSPPAQNARSIVYNALTNSFGGTVGNGVRAFMNDIVTNMSFPVMVIHAYQSGVSISSLGSGSTVYTALSAAITALSAKVHGFIWNQGEGDANGSSPMSTASYASALAAIHSGYAGAAGQTSADFPLLFSSIATYGGATDTYNSDTKWANFHDTQRALHGLNSNQWFAECRLDMVRAGTAPGSIDGYHQQAKSAEVSSHRLADFYKNLIAGSGTQNPWFITGASATSATTTTVTLTHALGTDFAVKLLPHGDGIGLLTAGTTIQGFAVSVDAWGTSLACTASKTNATTIVLTHASCSTTGRKLRYAWGFQGLTGQTPPTITDGLIVDNSTLAVPLTYESNFTVI